jgi:excisionase family DNA binding protein
MPDLQPPAELTFRTSQEYLDALALDALPEMLSAHDVMGRLGISRQLFHRLIAAGELSAVRVGPHTVRVFRASLIDYLKRNLIQ